MKMKKTTVARIFWAGAGVCVIASVLYFMGMIPLPVCAALLIVAFPVTVFHSSSAGWQESPEVTSRSSGTDMIAELVLATFFGLLLLGIHRKIIARIQRRPGPPIWQEILHMLKFSFKTTWIPKTASPVLFVGVVLIAIGIWTAAFYVLVSGGSMLVILGIYMLHKIVEHGFGLSSGSPYGKYGGVRSVISAASEIPLFVSVAVIAVYTHSLDLSAIMQYQQVHGPLLITAFPGSLCHVPRDPLQDALWPLLHR